MGILKSTPIRMIGKSRQPARETVKGIVVQKNPLKGGK